MELEVGWNQWRSVGKSPWSPVELSWKLNWRQWRSVERWVQLGCDQLEGLLESVEISLKVDWSH